MESFIQNCLSVLKIIVALTGSFVQGKTRLTHEPPSILYVSTGETARFVWNYTVGNRAEEFQLSSPKWRFINANNKPVDIGYEHGFYGWKWFINKKTCPPGLLNPVRVSKESTATLVISNVTTADNGIYEFVLLLKAMQPIRSKAQLFVTTKPIFNQFSNKAIVEGDELGINCSATGIPTPNITWVFKGITNEIKSQGIGHAYLAIQNITRQQEGIYTCQATNNPNEVPVVKETLVTVLYKPHFFNSTIFSNENKITLGCLVSGQPAPLITWYDPTGKKICSGTRDTTGGNVLTLETTNISDVLFGQYTCNATNDVGYQVHFINVTRKHLSTSKALTTKIEKKIDPTTPTVYKNISTGIPKHTARIDQAEESCYVAFYQGQTFTIIHLSITCVLIFANIIQIIFICLKVKKKRIKEDNGNNTQRFFRSAEAPVDEDAISLSPMEPVLTVETTPHKKAQSEDYERISDKSVSPSSIENTAQDNPTEIRLQETQHQYQELNDATLILNKQVYQSLHKAVDVVAQAEPTAVSEQKYESLKFADKPQSLEYQKLHLYADIELDKN